MDESKRLAHIFKPMIFMGGGLLFIALSYFLADKETNKDFYGSFLVNVWFWITLVLGSLFFAVLHHLVNAKWSVVLRRFFENLAATIGVLALVFIPVVLSGVTKIFKWADPEKVATDQLIQKKVAYLNVEFFTIRVFLFFFIWIAIAFLLRHFSIQQDKTGSEKSLARMRSVSAVGVILFALSFTFASFDWVMSLDPHWYSTIFGIYNFAGALVSCLAFTIIVVRILQSQGFLKIVTVEHYHDLGKLLFAFTCFWAYIAFSQYLLIWYANIPEETIWYAHRWEGSWKTMSLILVFGHFVLPFIFLLPRASKRHLPTLIFFSVWLLLMHYVDLQWLINPNFMHHGLHLAWFDATLFIGFTMLVFGAFIAIMSRAALYPVKDPILSESMHLKNF